MSDDSRAPQPGDDAGRRYEPDASPFRERRRPSVVRRTFPVSANLSGALTLTHFFVFDAEGLTDIDASDVEAVEAVVESLRRDDIVFVVARLKAPLEQQFTATNLIEKIGSEHLFPTVQASVEWCGVQREQRPSPPGRPDNLEHP